MLTRRLGGPRGRLILRLLGLVLSLAAAWLALLIRPAPLFAHSLRLGNLVLHSDAPLPAESQPLLREVARRVSRSPLFEHGRRYDVFLCNSPVRFGLLTPGGRGSGLTNPWGNVFIHGPDVVHDRVTGRNGELKTSERTLTYFIAHEVTHAMTFARIGWWQSRRVAAFQREGYADYVGFARKLDLAREREALRRSAPEMDPQRSGLYRRYELLVAFLLEHRGLPVVALFQRRLDQRAIEREFDTQQNL